MNTPAQNVELWEIEKFIPYARNPRKNDAAVDRMAASIQEFGFKIGALPRVRPSSPGSSRGNRVVAIAPMNLRQCTSGDAHPAREPPEVREVHVSQP